MSKPKSPDLPATPEYWVDPAYTRNLDTMEGLGNQLTSGDFTGKLEWLSPTININPDVTRTYFDSLKPYYNDMRQQTISQLAANNQLESSVTADRLGRIDTDVSNILQGKVSDQLTQAMQNRINLFGTGLNTINQVTGYSQTNQQNRNAFNLENYQNQVERALAMQGPSRGGLEGGLMGALGGGLTGFMLGGPAGAAVGAIGGGLAGGLSTSPGLGGQLMSTGASIYGSGRTPTGSAPVRPGSTASNTPFSVSNFDPYNSSQYTPEWLYGGLR